MIQGEIMLMTKDQLMEKSTVELVLEAKSELEREQQINTYLDRCRQMRCLEAGRKLIRAGQKDIKEQTKTLVVNNRTEFGYSVNELNCGMWIADMSGVKTFSDKGGYRLACYHPILITERLFNVDTKTEKVVLAYFRDNKWQTITVDKDVIASSSKIVKLAAYGIAVTSEMAKNLVAYLADIENLNDIPILKSTSKLGWTETGDFLPYDSNIKFDDESRFREVFNSIRTVGSDEIWMDLCKKIRTNVRHYEPQVYMAASFASILVSKLGMLPFIVNLWGGTGKGKTVAMMLACSIWANPGEGKYITDSYSTQNAFEARLDVQNHLPMFIDDMSKVSDRFDGGYTDFIYLVCSGRGKDRSNIDLGLNKAKTWSNSILTNMERPLANETMKGGAINRILDIEMVGDNIFENGNMVANILRDNYGWGGYLFVTIVNSLGIDYIADLRKDFEKLLKEEAQKQNSLKEEKQILPMSILLTADKIATDYIFKDQIYLDIPTMVKMLKDVEDVSEGKRAYDSIMDYTRVFKNKFIESDYAGENWGYIKDGFVNIIPSIMRKISLEQNFSIKAFCTWAKEHNVLRSNNGKNQNVVKINDKFQRFYSIKEGLIEAQIEEQSGFEYTQEEIPFD